jgi:hypothetical protein
MAYSEYHAMERWMSEATLEQPWTALTHIAPSFGGNNNTPVGGLTERGLQRKDQLQV